MTGSGGAADDGPAVAAPTLEAVAAAIRAAWALDTCDPVDVPLWTPERPSRGQCAVSALTLCDLLGGELLLADVVHADGSPQGVHYWNRLPDGSEVDLTRDQFAAGERIGEPRAVPVPPLADRGTARLGGQAALVRERTFASLGL